MPRALPYCSCPKGYVQDLSPVSIISEPIKEVSPILSEPVKEVSPIVSEPIKEVSPILEAPKETVGVIDEKTGTISPIELPPEMKRNLLMMETTKTPTLSESETLKLAPVESISTTETITATKEVAPTTELTTVKEVAPTEELVAIKPVEEEVSIKEPISATSWVPSGNYAD
jgi:hypothetical protein